jgi:hypothetical protein
MTDRLRKMVESCRARGESGVAARSGRVGSVLAREADRRGRGRVGERGLRPAWGWLTEPFRSVRAAWARTTFVPCGRARLAHLGWLTRSVGWFTGPGDGSMGPSPRVMNSIYI